MSHSFAIESARHGSSSPVPWCADATAAVARLIFDVGKRTRDVQSVQKCPSWRHRYYFLCSSSFLFGQDQFFRWAILFSMALPSAPTPPLLYPSPQRPPPRCPPRREGLSYLFLPTKMACPEGFCLSDSSQKLWQDTCLLSDSHSRMLGRPILYSEPIA